MNITINNESIQYNLENEKNVRTIITQLITYITNEGFIISNIHLNNEKINIAEHDIWGNIPITAITHIAIYCTTYNEFQIEKFTIISEYVNLLYDTCVYLLRNASEYHQMHYVFHEYTTIKDSLESITYYHTNIYSIIHDCITQLIPNKELNSSFLPHAIKILHKLIYFLEDRLLEVYDPHTVFTQTLNELKNMEKTLQELSIDIQMGKQTHAMHEINRFSNLLSTFLRCYDYIRHENHYNDTLFQNIILTIQEHIKELIHTIENQDIVLMADILEYDIVPQINELQQLCS